MTVRIVPVLLLLALCATNVGCAAYAEADNPTFYWYSFRNLFEAALELRNKNVMFDRDWDRAEKAWRAYEAACPGPAPSDDFYLGFKKGFVEFVEADGSGEPPATPPFRYRNFRYQTPAGIQAIEDWYAGFRAGAAAARASGLRETIVIPMSAPPLNVVPRVPVAMPPFRPVSSAAVGPTEGLIVLPKPSPLPPAEGPIVLPRPAPVPRGP
jgi:hypothetical protein